MSSILDLNPYHKRLEVTFYSDDNPLGEVALQDRGSGIEARIDNTASTVFRLTGVVPESKFVQYCWKLLCGLKAKTLTEVLRNPRNRFSDEQRAEMQAEIQAYQEEAR